MRDLTASGHARALAMTFVVLVGGVFVVSGMLALRSRRVDVPVGHGGRPEHARCVVLATEADRASRLGATIGALQQQGYAVTDDVGQKRTIVGNDTRVLVLAPGVFGRFDRAVAQAAYARGATVAALDVTLADLIAAVDSWHGRGSVGTNGWPPVWGDVALVSVITKDDGPNGNGRRRSSDYLHTPRRVVDLLHEHRNARNEALTPRSLNPPADVPVVVPSEHTPLPSGPPPGSATDIPASEPTPPPWCT